MSRAIICAGEHFTSSINRFRVMFVEYCYKHTTPQTEALHAWSSLSLALWPDRRAATLPRGYICEATELPVDGGTPPAYKLLNRSRVEFESPLGTTGGPDCTARTIKGEM